MNGGMRGDEDEHGYYQPPIPPEPPKKNGLLTLLLSSGGDVSVKLITLALVVVTGGGNLFQGAQLSTETHEGIERSMREIHQLYARVEETERRQLQALRNQEQLIESNIKQVRNTQETLNTQHELLELVRRTQKRFLDDKGFLGGDKPPPF